MALALLAVLSLLTVINCQSEQTIVYIDGEKGVDCPECFNSTLHQSCRTLSFVAAQLSQRNLKHLVEIVIEGEVLDLRRGVEFSGYSELSISGSNTTVNCAGSSGAGLAFVDVQGLRLHSLSVEGCGTERNSTSVNPHSPNQTECLRVAVYILNCTDVSIDRVDIRSSNGTGLSLYDTGGTVEITDCQFTANRLEHGEESLGGGGVHIEFTLCPPGHVGKCPGRETPVNSSNYTIQNCSFSRNDAYCPASRQMYISPFIHKAVPRLGRGGGLYISIGSNATANNISIQDCTFENNTAIFGGSGAVIEFIDLALNNSVHMHSIDFLENNCSVDNGSLCSGAGLVVDAMFYDHSKMLRNIPRRNKFSCICCKFENNKASIGGGTGIYMTKDIKGPDLEAEIRFLNCSWVENKAPMGAAVFISPGVWDYTREGFVPSPKFVNCSFESNSAVQEISPNNNSPGVKILSVGYGALFVSESKVRFYGETVFENNNGSALHLSNSIASFGEHSRVTFCGNVGHNGGAIGMYGSSTLQIQDYSYFLFEENRAFSKGGAIYVEFSAPLQPVYHNCFISSPNFTQANSTLFEFKGNKGNDSGESIFTTTFQPCQLLCPSINSTELLSPKDILKCIAEFNFSEPENISLATRPKFFKLHEETPVRIIPGSEYTLNLKVQDEAKTNLSNVVYEASVKPSTVKVDKAFMQVSNNTICLLGPYGAMTELSLCASDTIVVFNVNLTRCQPGYLPNKENTKCECRAPDYLGLQGCDPTVYIGKDYWMGLCSEKKHTLLCTSFCPPAFCFNRNDIKYNHIYYSLPDKHNISLLDQKLCGPTRTGRLCGSCADNYSIYFNSIRYKCGHEDNCHLGLLFYFIAEIIPLTILFLIIIFYNISFTTGNISCFVFYAQILRFVIYSPYGGVRLSNPLMIIHSVVTVIYNPFSMDFFTIESLSFCLWKGANFMDVMIMKYVTVCFALALVLATIILARHGYLKRTLFTRFQTPNSILIQGLTAFFVLCYAQSVRVTSHILNFTCLYRENFICTGYVVNRMGTLTFLQGGHIKYAILAFLVLIFLVLIPPILLIAYPLVFKLLGHCGLSESKLAKCIWRLLPIQFLDAFQSSFKDKYRFFAGLYFLYRVVILGLSMLCQSLLQFYSIVQLQLIVALVMQAVFQPHKNKRHNTIDTLLIVNLAAINTISFYYYATKDYSKITSFKISIDMLAVIQAVLVILPLLYLAIQAIKLKRFCRREGEYENLPKLRSTEHDSLLGDW